MAAVDVVFLACEVLLSPSTFFYYFYSQVLVVQGGFIGINSIDACSVL
jgi:hypothetical protein